MAIRDLFLFMLVCLLTGFLIFAGSILGHSLGQTGLFAGAVVGGFVGIGLAVWLASRFGLLSAGNLIAPYVGGSLSFVIAAVIAVNTLFNPVIPLASILLIGIGTLLGKTIGQRRAERRREPRH